MKIPKCQFCGQEILSWQSMVSADGGCKGSVIFAHEDCCHKRAYSFKNNNEHHKPTDCGFQWGAEFETNSRTSLAQRLQLWSWYKLICTDDCTVNEEFKSSINKGLHGVKDMLDGIQEIVDISSGENCGTHANVSLENWDNYTMVKIHNYALQIFSPLANYLKEHTADTIEVFGRDFGSYREFSTNSFQHGDWLNIKSKCLEFRLAKFQNTQQYFYLLAMLKEMCLALNNFIKSYSGYSSIDSRNANKVGNKLVKIFQKRVNGTATYMSRERNTKER